MQLLDGKFLSAQIKAEIKIEVEQIKANGGKTPHLAAILVGNNGASETYVASKIRSCEEIGFKSTLIRLNDTASEAEVLAEIQKLNQDPDVDGFIVQLPLPAHISENCIMEAVNPAKDVDGFHPINVGRMCKGLPESSFCLLTVLSKIFSFRYVPVNFNLWCSLAKSSVNML